MYIIGKFHWHLKSCSTTPSDIFLGLLHAKNFLWCRFDKPPVAHKGDYIESSEMEKKCQNFPHVQMGLRKWSSKLIIVVSYSLKILLILVLTFCFYFLNLLQSYRVGMILSSRISISNQILLEKNIMKKLNKLTIFRKKRFVLNFLT